MIQCVLRWNNERLYKTDLENGKSFTIGSGKNDTIYIEGLLPGQLKFTYKKGSLYASGKNCRICTQRQSVPVQRCGVLQRNCH